MKTVIFTLLVLIFVSTAWSAEIVLPKQSYTNTPNYSYTFTFAKFDQSLGTLLSVEAYISFKIDNGYLNADNDGVDGGNLTGELGAIMNITESDVRLVRADFNPFKDTIKVVNEFGPVSIAGNDGDPQGQYDTGGADNVEFDGGLVQASDSSEIFSGVYSDYIGNAGDTFDVDLSVDTTMTFGGVSGIEGAFGPVSATPELQFIYTYEPSTPQVPEPSVLILFISVAAFIAIGKIRK